jgi:hypothetical protein
MIALQGDLGNTKVQIEVNKTDFKFIKGYKVDGHIELIGWMWETWAQGHLQHP